MSTLRDDIEAFERRVGEQVEAVAIGMVHDPVGARSREPVLPLSRDEAMARLELHREYDADFASDTPPNAIYAWTASWVLFLSGYDGATEPSWVPRHPMLCTPVVDDYSNPR